MIWRDIHTKSHILELIDPNVPKDSVFKGKESQPTTVVGQTTGISGQAYQKWAFLNIPKVSKVPSASGPVSWLERFWIKPWTAWYWSSHHQTIRFNNDCHFPIFWLSSSYIFCFLWKLLVAGHLLHARQWERLGINITLFKRYWEIDSSIYGNLVWNWHLKSSISVMKMAFQVTF